LDNRASICSQPNGVTCFEELPLGLKATFTYTVVGRDQLAEEDMAQSEKGEAESKSSLLSLSTIPMNSQLYLVEEVSVTVLKPVASFVKLKERNTPLKTENLLKVLKSFGGTQKDIMSILAEINGMRTHVDADVDAEKAKNE